MQPAPSEALRERVERLAKAQRALRIREERRRQENPDGGLHAFVKYFWSVLEPVDPFVDGWVLHCLCAHLEAISRGDEIELAGQKRKFNRMLANVPPGFMKSMLVNVFWPSWEWGPLNRPHLRYVAFSYAQELTVRDNAKFRDLIKHERYQEMWGHRFQLTSDAVERVKNDKTGFKFATSILGVGTGERGHRVLIDDPHKVKGTAETDDTRLNTTNWVEEGAQNRLNDLQRDAIIVIMQRLHENDSSGVISRNLGDQYAHLLIPMEYYPGVHFSHYAGWNDGLDPREEKGELAWPERYPGHVLRSFRRNSYLWAGQYQQNPIPRGGGIFKDDWIQPYEVPASGVYDFEPIFTLASLDTAYKEKEENDFSALVVLSIYDHPKTKQRRIMLTDGWHRKLPLHGRRTMQLEGEDDKVYLRRASRDWGLCEWVHYTCKKRRVDRLIVEDSSRGPDVNEEIRRLFGDRDWGVVLEPARGDKWSRANAVVSIFTDDMVYAPGEWTCTTHGYRGCNECPPEQHQWWWRDWVQEIITELCSFPRGTHDDYVDAVVQGLRHMRRMGLAIRRDEREFMELEMAKYRKPSKALYPV